MRDEGSRLRVTGVGSRVWRGGSALALRRTFVDAAFVDAVVVDPFEQVARLAASSTRHIASRVLKRTAFARA